MNPIKLINTTPYFDSVHDGIQVINTTPYFDSVQDGIQVINGWHNERVALLEPGTTVKKIRIFI